MEIPATGTIPGDTTEVTDIGASPANQSLGQEAFLQLLVAQLRYQDPMSPADSQSFLAQTAQFTTVETLEQIAESIATSNRNQEMATIGALVGRNVEYADSDGQLVQAQVVAARSTEDGILLSLPGRDLLLDDVVAIVVPPAAG